MISWAILSSALAFLAVASPVPESDLQPRARAHVYSSCSVPDTVALTFDDGPYDYIYDISGKLLEKGAKGTFFFNGNNYECIYSDENIARIRYVYESGHQVASHTWSHPHLNQLSWDQVHDEMWRVEQALQRIVGVTPAFMRPPYGEYNDNVREVARARGQSLATWDFDSGDSVGVSASDSIQRYRDIANQRPSNILALNHEVYASTVWEVLSEAIDILQAKGYRLVTLAECLGKEPYQNVGQRGQKDGSWQC
ncbi:carbohydrate esterase family 4 protein [Schizophyllum commune H4-8]|uniref:Carbohydrate esterase family 4 protein n=1 Tax=Schizophyllum commune (strain H4-8 / FGSC 9210) TaxID=578458 RepID=D8QHK0_SCHCM|nr:carbohydrate esterase family 4 protein [Schizophyllum commune H4-8]KAI5887221.1 carbohydrate esterase family 4 protein [Schizophyllum commune H4-8]